MAAGFQSIEKLSARTHDVGEKVGNFLVDVFHLLALFAIGGTIVWAAVLAFIGMVEGGGTNIEDILDLLQK